jgi:hypothetical protein
MLEPGPPAGFCFQIGFCAFAQGLASDIELLISSSGVAGISGTTPGPKI